MLSFTRVFTTYPSRIPPSFSHLPKHSLVKVKCSNEDNDDAAGGSSLNASSSSISPPPKPVEIRFKRGSRRRRKQELSDEADEKPVKQASRPKDWETMTLGEKALELYMGEKGMLFWLNKFAYASIFIIIGGWIVFRFVGPALNLYQLDAPPLSPTAIFK